MPEAGAHARCMEFELTIIRDGVRTVVAFCEEMQARSASSGAIHRTPLTPALSALDDHSAEVMRMFVYAVQRHIIDSHPTLAAHEKEVDVTGA